VNDAATQATFYGFALARKSHDGPDGLRKIRHQREEREMTLTDRTDEFARYREKASLVRTIPASSRSHGPWQCAR
jgi:hypothetical protein